MIFSFSTDIHTYIHTYNIAVIVVEEKLSGNKGVLTVVTGVEIAPPELNWNLPPE